MIVRIDSIRRLNIKQCSDTVIISRNDENSSKTHEATPTSSGASSGNPRKTQGHSNFDDGRNSGSSHDGGGEGEPHSGSN
jgi:hypothetical protein